jgi:hypothetical protein
LVAAVSVFAVAGAVFGEVAAPAVCGSVVLGAPFIGCAFPAFLHQPRISAA